MDRLKRLFANRYFLLYLILLAGAAGIGWQINLEGRRADFERLADYYTMKARQGTPASMARYSGLARKYRDAAARPWMLSPQRQPEW